MRWDPSDPTARNVDYFVLSKGHAAPILWAALSD
jgi:transketolase